jgi:acetoin utilization deacetylase AcuC-like enzyme
MELLPQDFGLFAEKCKQFFPRVMFGLEGGYALDSLAESVLEVVKVYANHHH